MGRLGHRLASPSCFILLAAAEFGAASCAPDMRLAGDDEADDVESRPDLVDAEAASELVEGSAEDVGEPLPDYCDSSDRDEGHGDGATTCPVWAVPSPTGGPEDGTAAYPFGGLQLALDGRGDCDTIVLRDGSSDQPFDAGVDLRVEDGESLTIMGSPSAAAKIELSAHDTVGMFATGVGTLILRHLAIRSGRAAEGGCLNAQIGTLWLDDTEWTDCRAENAGGGAWIWAQRVWIQRSMFLRCEATSGNGGAAWIEGPPDTAEVLVEDSRFEQNAARQGGALYVRAQSRANAVRNSVFARNQAGLSGSAVVGYLGEVWHSLFQENGPDEDEGDVSAVVAWGTEDTRLWHNLFRGNRSRRTAPALQVDYGLAHNNLFVDNSCAHPRFGGACCGAVTVSTGGIRNNTFVDNTGMDAASHLNINDPLGTCSSNLFVGGSGSWAVGNEFPELRASPALMYNAWWDAPDPVWGPGVVLGDGNIQADPAFDDLMDDYRLGADSACRDAGDPDGSLEDADGSRNDIGAFGGPDGEWSPLIEGAAS